MDCEVPIALGERPLLSFNIEDGKLFVSVDVPAPPARSALLVRDNRVEGATAAASATAGLVTLSVGGETLLRAALASPDTVHVEELDLRPLGLAIVAGRSNLRLGASLLADNTFVGARVGVQLGAGAAQPT